jgi:hypothetical protein
MTQQPTPVARKRLVLVRQLYQRAALEAERSASVVSRMMAVIGFDLATETALKAVVADFQSNRQPADNFNGLIQQCETALDGAGLGPLGDRANVFHVHEIRNDAQHKARYPSPVEVSDARTYTRDALDKLTQQVWGIQFESLRLGSLIENAEVQRLALDGEQALAENETRKAVEDSGGALELALLRVRKSLVGEQALMTPKILVDNRRGPKADPKLGRAFKQMQDLVLLGVFGIPYSTYMHYRSIAGHSVFALGDTRPGFHGGADKPSLEEAEFVVGFAIDTVTRIEEEVGDLDKPYGRDWWGW